MSAMAAPAIAVHFSVVRSLRRKRRPRVSFAAGAIPGGGEGVGMSGAELSATRARHYPHENARPAAFHPSRPTTVAATGASMQKTHHRDGEDDTHHEARRRDPDDEPEPRFATSRRCWGPRGRRRARHRIGANGHDRAEAARRRYERLQRGGEFATGPVAIFG